MKRSFQKIQLYYKGFSLVEVLASITIIGIIIFLAIPNIVQMMSDGEETLARARAETLNMAIASYVQALGPTTASNSWSGKTDQQRYSELRPYLAFAPDDLTNANGSGFMPVGWSVTMPPNIYPMTNKIRPTNVTP